MINRQMTANIKNTACVIIPMTAREYCKAVEKSISIFENYSYYFLLDEQMKYKYVLNFTDIKGGISFLFKKFLATPEELEKYKDRSTLYEPLENEFSKDQMSDFMTWFVFYLEGFMESFEKYYNEGFARRQDYRLMIYGYKDNMFFLGVCRT